MTRLPLPLLALLLAGCTSHAEPAPATNAPRAAPPFENGAYLNPGFKKGAFDLVRYYATRTPGVWARKLDTPPGPRPPARVGTGALRATVVNHATVLLQYDGVNVLTDPIWSARASPVQWAGPERYVPPMIAFEDLPPIDAVLISHNHYDHLDLPTLQRLEAAFHPTYIVGERQGALLREAGLQKVVELNWATHTTLANGQKVWGTEAVHWTGRKSFSGRNASLWMSYVLGTSQGPVYFAGDTGYGGQFAAAQKQFGPMRLALLPIGAYKPRWLTAFQHMDPCEAATAHRELRAAQSIAIHYGTFELSDDGQTEPIQELARCVNAQGIAPERFSATPFGSGYDVPTLPSSTVTE